MIWDVNDLLIDHRFCGIQKVPFKVKGLYWFMPRSAHTHHVPPLGNTPPLSVLSFEHSPRLVSGPPCSPSVGVKPLFGGDLGSNLSSGSLCDVKSIQIHASGRLHRRGRCAHSALRLLLPGEAARRPGDVRVNQGAPRGR